MHVEPQTSLHAIGPPFNSSGGAMIHWLCTDHLSRCRFDDKIDKGANARDEINRSDLRSGKGRIRRDELLAATPSCHTEASRVGGSF
jgi:hypothetical protein